MKANKNNTGKEKSGRLTEYELVIFRLAAYVVGGNEIADLYTGLRGIYSWLV
jgi:hypothetical protein